MKNKIKLGSICSEDFGRNFKLLMDIFSVISKDVKYKLNFYSHHKVSSGYKYQDEYLSGSITVVELDLSSYEFDDLDYKLLIEKIKDNHEKREDFIQKDYRINNALGEYYDEEYYIGEPDYCESLDFDVFVDVIKL